MSCVGILAAPDSHMISSSKINQGSTISSGSVL